MVFTDSTLKYFSIIPFRVRSAMATTKSSICFEYEDEPFYNAYNAIFETWIEKKSQRYVAKSYNISRRTLTKWENEFVKHGTIGLLASLSYVEIDHKLELLTVLVKSARPHERANYTLKLAEAIGIHNVSLDHIRRIHRCYGYGQRMDSKEFSYYSDLQHIVKSVEIQKLRPKKFLIHNSNDRKNTFFNYTYDHPQQRIELFRTISKCSKKRQIRPILKEFGVSPNRFYYLKKRYMTYGVWGLVDLVQKGQVGEKISTDVELQIIEERLMYPDLSTSKMIKKLKLKCSKANVQKIYKKWGLSQFQESIQIRGVISQPMPSVSDKKINEDFNANLSAKMRFPDLIEMSNLKVNKSFLKFLKCLSYKKVSISNPGVFIVAPFLSQLGVVEALHTYAPKSYLSSEITSSIILNTLRIIAGFPTIHDYTMNSDRSVAIASGLTINPGKSRFYESFDNLRFNHLQSLRNDASSRAQELGIIEGKEIAIDYHCDQSDSRFPRDKSLSKSPDKNGDIVYAHRPQIIWDSINNSIINIAYCEGASRAPTALYKFCENNLFKIIDPDVITEIYADSEYTGEKQLVYLAVRSQADITMCLKQNPKIKKWKEITINKNIWEDYGSEYRISSHDFQLSETGKDFRFIVKQNKETDEIRCFGSTHLDHSPKKILNSYHIRWPVETGIKDLIENYFLNKPTGTSPEKVETHYYCVMLARLCIDYARLILAISKWQTPENWKCVLSSMRTSLFSNQNCELSLNDSGDFLLTYLDGDRSGIKRIISEILQKRKVANLNKVPWWGNRGIQIEVKDQYNFI
jgi:hypothetical protein